MKNCLPSIVSAALCLSLVMTPFVPVAAAYADEGSPAESSDCLLYTSPSPRDS